MVFVLCFVTDRDNFGSITDTVTSKLGEETLIVVVVFWFVQLCFVVFVCSHQCESATRININK